MILISYELLIGKIAEQKKLRRLTYMDIAKMTGYKPNTINMFMNGYRQSENVARAIARALNVEM